MKYKQIVVLGANGMLGQMVVYFFKRQGYTVLPISQKFTTETISTMMNLLNELEDSIVINCIGKIPQKSLNEMDLTISNTLLPLELSRKLKDTHLLIHPSTDCVFSGTDNIIYPKTSDVNPKDYYGLSKAWGEFILTKRPNTIITRVSIIGPDKNSDKGLLQWFLSQKPGKSVNGFTDHFWNGITTYEWCKQVDNLLQSFTFGDNLFIQLGSSDNCSKYELLLYFNDIFNKGVNIIPFSTGQKVDRRLQPERISPPIKEQLIEMKNNYHE